MKTTDASGVGWYLSVPKRITKTPAKTSNRAPAAPIDTCRKARIPVRMKRQPEIVYQTARRACVGGVTRLPFEVRVNFSPTSGPLPLTRRGEKDYLPETTLLESIRRRYGAINRV